MTLLPVVFVLPRGSLLLDWAGPAEALRIATQELAAPGSPGGGFALHFVAPQAQSQSSVGAMLCGLAPLPAHLPGPAWVVVVGKTGTGASNRPARADAAEVRAVVAWLARLRPGQAESPGLRLVTVCAGALLAAEAGLLDGRHCTTHHLDLELLRSAAPRAQVVADRVFVQDGEVWSRAGVIAGIDLALHLVAAHCGPVVAARTAQCLAVALRRGPDDPRCCRRSWRTGST